MVDAPATTWAGARQPVPLLGGLSMKRLGTASDSGRLGTALLTVLRRGVEHEENHPS